MRYTSHFTSIIILIALLFAVAPAQAMNRKEALCMAKNIYHEARGDLTYTEKKCREWRKDKSSRPPYVDPNLCDHKESWRAVYSVVLNRVKSEHFPDNICDVIYQKNIGCQFSWTCDNISDEPKNKEMFQKILRDVLAWDANPGFQDPTGGALFYIKCDEQGRFQASKTGEAFFKSAKLSLLRPVLGQHCYYRLNRYQNDPLAKGVVDNPAFGVADLCRRGELMEAGTNQPVKSYDGIPCGTAKSDDQSSGLEDLSVKGLCDACMLTDFRGGIVTELPGYTCKCDPSKLPRSERQQRQQNSGSGTAQ